MHENLREVAEYMQRFGRSSLAHALSMMVGAVDASSDYGYNSSELAVLHAAHAAEILIKSRIAEEHPLLIFSTIPKSTKSDDLLDIKALFEDGKTINYAQLPERLWATTGYKLRHSKDYQDFGKLRNNIQHFAPSKSSRELKQATLHFIFHVLDTFIAETWEDGYAITCFEYPDHTDEQDELFKMLFFWEIPFRYPEHLEKRVQKARNIVAQWPHRGKDVIENEKNKPPRPENITILPFLWQTKR